MEYHGYHFATSIGLLNFGIQTFPTEWKLLLERVNQFILHEQFSEALRLTVDALKHTLELVDSGLVTFI